MDTSVGLILSNGHHYYYSKTVSCLEKIVKASYVVDFKFADYDNPNLKNILLNNGLDQITKSHLAHKPGSHVWVVQLDYGEVLPKSFINAIPSMIEDADKNHFEGIAFSLNDCVDGINQIKGMLPQEIRIVKYNGSQYYWGGPARFISGINRVKAYDLEIVRRLPKVPYEEHTNLVKRLQDIKDRRPTPDITFSGKVCGSWSPK